MKVSDEQLVNYIRRFVDRYGFPPTQVEMATHFGVSRNTIIKALKRLKEAGMVSATAGHRSIRVMK